MPWRGSMHSTNPPPKTGSHIDAERRLSASLPDPGIRVCIQDPPKSQTSAQLNQETTNDGERGPGSALSLKRTILLALLIAFPSLGPTQKYIGLWFIPLQILITALVIQSSIHIFLRYGQFLRKRFLACAALALFTLLAGYFVLNPYEDGKGPGRSSDRDEALELAVSRLIQCQYPYYQRSDVAGPLSSFPGSIILATPFAMLGDVGLQNIFWLLVFVLAARNLERDGAIALWILIIPFLLSPAAAYEWISGGDLIANGIFVAMALFAALHSWSSAANPLVWRVATAAGLGIALASRANFVFVLPVFAGAVTRASGWRHAILACSITGFTALLITLPFFLAAPHDFTPLMSRGKISLADPSLWWVPHLVIGLMTITSAVAGIWMIRSQSGDHVHPCLAGCAMTMLVPNLAMVSIISLLKGSLDFGFTRDRFGLIYVFFALLAWPPIAPASRKDSSQLAAD